MLSPGKVPAKPMPRGVLRGAPMYERKEQEMAFASGGEFGGCGADLY